MLCPVCVIAFYEQKGTYPGISAVDFARKLAIWRGRACYLEGCGAGIGHLYGFQFSDFCYEVVVAVAFFDIIRPQFVCHGNPGRMAEDPEIPVDQDQGSIECL